MIAATYIAAAQSTEALRDAQDDPVKINTASEVGMNDTKLWKLQIQTFFYHNSKHIFYTS